MASAGRNLAKLIGANKKIKLTGGGGDSDFNVALDSDATKLATLEREIKARLDSDAANPITNSTLNMGSNDVVTTGKVYFANMFSTEGDLPSASTYHGMFAHVHATGAAYFAHSGSWVKLANNSALGGSGFDSDQVVSIINENVTVGGGGSGFDSDQVVSIINENVIVGGGIGRTIFNYTISGTPTTVTGTDANGNTLAYTAGHIDVFVNGIRMAPVDITASNGTSIVFGSALVNGDVVDIIAYTNVAATNFDSDQVVSIINENVTVGGSGFDSDQVVSIINENVTVGGGGITYESKDSDFTAVAGKGYFVDTTSGVVTVNLPTSANLGDEIIFIDYANQWSTNSMFLHAPPLNYQTFADSDIEITSGDYSTVHIIYSGATQGWLPRKYAGGQQSESTVEVDGAIDGGYRYTVDGYRYYKFTSSATFVVNQTVTAQAIMVAGGGGGGRDDYSGGRGAGGGGAGGMVDAQTLNLVSGNNLTIVIGAGGTNAGTSGAPGTNGGNTTVTGLTNAIGGGGGGSHSASTNIDNASSGGSGGGGTNGRDGKSGTSGQGNEGADGYSALFSYGGGGGGGKGAAATTNSGGAGSNTYSAWATATSSGDNGYFAGGGAGGGGNVSGTINGSNGGGGSANNGPGTVNTGGGGGGNKDTTLGAGGSGIVIIRYAV